MQHALGLLVLRIGFGSLMLINHGIGKITNFAERSSSFPDPIGIGPIPSLIFVIFAEVVCAILVILGVKTRWASIPILIVMIIAIVTVHNGHPFDKIELPLLYLTGSLSLILLGGGRYSVLRD